MGDHVVQLYQEEHDLACALSRYAAEGLARGEGVVIIGSAARWQALAAALRAGGVDTHGAVLRGQLRLFGELTDILWGQGKREAAAAIERFWNALARSQPFSLLCAYPLDSLDGRCYDGALQAVCALHTHLAPAPDSDAFNAAVSAAVREVLEPQLVGMLHSLSAQHRPETQMPIGQAVMLWLRQHMPRTAEKVLARARARIEA